jgi:hypothetical protein
LNSQFAKALTKLSPPICCDNARTDRFCETSDRRIFGAYSKDLNRRPNVVALGAQSFGHSTTGKILIKDQRHTSRRETRLLQCPRTQRETCASCGL